MCGRGQNRSWRYAPDSGSTPFATVFILRFRATSIDIHLRSSDQLLAQLWKECHFELGPLFIVALWFPFQFRRSGSIAIHERFIIPIFCYRTCLPASRINLSRSRFQQNFPSRKPIRRMNRVNASEQVVCRKSKGLRNQNILTGILLWW